MAISFIESPLHNLSERPTFRIGWSQKECINFSIHFSIPRPEGGGHRGETMILGSETCFFERSVLDLIENHTCLPMMSFGVSEWVSEQHCTQNKQKRQQKLVRCVLSKCWGNLCVTMHFHIGSKLPPDSQGCISS